MPGPGRIACRVAALCGAAALAMTVSAPAASAHDTTLTVGASTATVHSDHTQVTVCDNEDDGRRVYAEFAGHPLGGPPDQIYDSYGGSCTTASLSPFAVALWWRFCEVGGSCVFTLL